MIYRFFTLGLGLFFLHSSIQIKAQGFGVEVDSVEAVPNQVICVPVFAKGFSEIVSFQYSLTFDNNVLNFDHMQNFNLPGQQSDFYNLIAPNRLLVGWTPPNGLPQSLTDGSVVVETCFKVVALAGNSSDIIPGGEGFPPGSGSAEAYNKNYQDVWTAALLVPGHIEVVYQSGSSGTADLGQNGAAVFQLSPNPTQASSQVLFHSKNSEMATLSVTDAAGKTVLEQKIAVKAGENRFEIPANALLSKGMYQVTLKTKDGVSSQMLSVQ